MAIKEADRADWRALMIEGIAASQDAAAAALAGSLIARMRGDFTAVDAVDLFQVVRRALYPEDAADN